MHEWVTAHLKEHTGASLEEQRAWWITLKWYFDELALDLGFLNPIDQLGDAGKWLAGILFSEGPEGMGFTA